MFSQVTTVALQKYREEATKVENQGNTTPHLQDTDYRYRKFLPPPDQLSGMSLKEKRSKSCESEQKKEKLRRMAPRWLQEVGVRLEPMANIPPGKAANSAVINYTTHFNHLHKTTKISVCIQAAVLKTCNLHICFCAQED